MLQQDDRLSRRGLFRRAAGAAMAAAAGAKAQATRPAGAIPLRVLGKTAVRLPMLGYGGAALPKKWGNPLSFEDRVRLVRYAYDRGIRYFDTSISYTYGESQAIIGRALKGVREKVFLTTKVDFWNVARPDGRMTKVPKGEATRQVEMNLRELQTDHLDAILIHGTPGVEQMTVAQCLEVRAELDRARKKGLVRFVGFSAHGYFDKALALIESGGFDLCMLALGYLPRGHDQRFSPKALALRRRCLAAANARKMGIVAMKVVGAGLLGAWARYVVPGFDRGRAARLPGAAIRWAMQDRRVQMLTIGMRLPGEVDANIATVAGRTDFTAADRALLEAFGPRALKSEAMRKMKVE